MADGPIIICGPAKECRDPHPCRWYCMRGHELGDKPAEEGVCHIAKCVMADVRAAS